MSTFLSYSQQDRSVAEALQAALLRENIKFWRDTNRLLAGDHLSARIFAAIEVSSSYVILLSAASATSAWVARELAFALEREAAGQVTVVAACLDDALPPDVLSDRLHVDLRPGRLDHGIAELVSLLRTLDDPAPPVGRLAGPVPRSFTDHGIEVGRTAAGAFRMQLDIVSFDLDEQYTVLTQFVFEGGTARPAGFNDTGQIDRILVACADEFQLEPSRLGLRSGDVKRATMTLTDDDDTFSVSMRVRRLGTAGRGVLVFNVGALFEHICETYGIRLPDDGTRT